MKVQFFITTLRTITELQKIRKLLYKYLRTMKNFEQDGRFIDYLNEMWFDSMTPQQEPELIIETYNLSPDGKHIYLYYNAKI